MKRIALALTWDGARWPVGSLSPKARAFLGERVTPAAGEVTELFESDQVRELRICWVPRLKGGEDVLSVPFATQTRIGFKTTKTIALGEMLGVIYTR